MNYSHYTHDLLIKNPQEAYKNTALELDPGTQKRIKSLIKSEPQDRTKRTIAIPGLINLHTHLAYSTLKIRPQNLFPWLKDLVKRIYKINHLGEGNSLDFDLYGSYLEGLREALSFGTTYIVDNSSHAELGAKVCQETGMQALIGVEVFGSDPDLAEKIFTEAKTKITELENIFANTTIEFALSPHASYDVSPELWHKCLAWSKARHKLMLSHVSESAAEEAWFQDKDSAEAKTARDFWTSINTLESKIKNWTSYRSALEFLASNKMLDESLLLTHLCYADDKDLELIRQSGAKLVSCPRSNAYLNNRKADTDKWLAKRIPFGIGTDSKASNYSLDLRTEVNQLSNLTANQRLELISLSPAKILSKEQDLGSLDEGKQADWVVLEILKTDINLETVDPFKLALDTELSQVREVYINGELKYHNQAIMLEC